MNTVDFLIERGPLIGEDYLWALYARERELVDFYVFDDKEMEEEFQGKIEKGEKVVLECNYLENHPRSLALAQAKSA